MKPNFKDITIIETASYICDQLLKIGIKTTLSGGFCVEVYSFGEYTSMDIDLIDQSIFMHRQLKSKMEEMGFVQEGKHFRHPDISYTVEFPSSPLAIGQELIKEERIAETLLLLEEGKVNDCKANLHAHVRQSMSSRCDRKK